MRIALISYEYPPDSAWGGIGTYTYQAATLLTQQGQTVEVFSVSPQREGSFDQDGILVHRVQELKRERFLRAIARIFKTRNSEAPFDVMESPEYLCEGLGAHENCPEVPLVVKLHGPSKVLGQLGLPPDDSLRADLVRYPQQVMSIAGAIKHRRPVPPFYFRKVERQKALDADRREAVFARKANLVVSPSTDLLKSQILNWGLSQDGCIAVPNPFEPSQALLELQPGCGKPIITFTGRLEVRKGILDLVEALPTVLKRFPEWGVCFAGRSVPLPQFNIDAQEYILKHLGQFGSRIQFTGAFTAADLPGILAATSICVFPSIWENFPNVCLEAMSAGRAVVGSSAGGMAEMITDRQNGLLVPSQNPAAIAERLSYFIEHPDERTSFGVAARETVKRKYNSQVIGSALIESYRIAISRKKAGLTAGSTGV